MSYALPRSTCYVITLSYLCFFVNIVLQKLIHRANSRALHQHWDNLKTPPVKTEGEFGPNGPKGNQIAVSSAILITAYRCFIGLIGLEGLDLRLIFTLVILTSLHTAARPINTAPTQKSPDIILY